MAKKQAIKGFGLISEELKNQKFTLNEIMEKAGVSLPTAVRIRKGEPCSLSVVQKVCDALGLEIVIKKI